MYKKFFYKKYGHKTSSEALCLSGIQNYKKILKLANFQGYIMHTTLMVLMVAHNGPYYPM